MGNSGAVGGTHRKRFESEVQYELHKKKDISELFNCEITLYQERSTLKLVAAIGKENRRDQLDVKKIKALEERMKNNHPSLIKLLGYYGDIETESICGNSYQYCYYVDYPIGTLINEIDLRKYLNKPFREIDIWLFLITVVSGLVEIKKAEKFCRNISSSTIFVDEEGGYRISEQFLVKDTSLYDEVAQRIFAKDMYLSPEQVEILAKDITNETQLDSFLNDIFSLGVLIIEMMYLENQGDLFKYNKDEDYLCAKVKLLKDRLKDRQMYSQTLLRLVNQMIEKKKDERITLEELSEQMDQSYMRYLVNQFGQEEANIIKQKEKGKTQFLSYIINKGEYEEHFRKSGMINSNNSDEQHLRRAKANKAKKYASKLGVEGEHTEEEEDLIEDSNIENNDLEDNGKQQKKSKGEKLWGSQNVNGGGDDQKMKLSEYFAQQAEQLKEEKERQLQEEMRLLQLQMEQQKQQEEEQRLQEIQRQKEQQEEEERIALEEQERANLEQQELERQKIIVAQQLQNSKAKLEFSKNNENNKKQNKTPNFSQDSVAHSRSNNQQYWNPNRANYYPLQQSNSHSRKSSPQEEARKQNHSPNEKCNLDRYNLRVNKHNVCTDRYALVSSCFSTQSNKAIKSQSDSNKLVSSTGPSFQNKVIQKQSISQILLSSSKKNPSNNGSPIKTYPNTSSQQVQDLDKYNNIQQPSAAPPPPNYFSQRQQNLPQSARNQQKFEIPMLKPGQRNKNLFLNNYGHIF